MANRSLLAHENLEALGENSYPGRGIVMGRAAAGNLIQVYWVMGRRENSRNRILKLEDDIVSTEAFDPSKVTDPSLIIYNAMRSYMGHHIVSNGDQTDTVVSFLETGGTVEEALATREFEPDKPNFTPRITGVLSPNQNPLFWIARKEPKTDDVTHSRYSYGIRQPYVGYCVHTYEENSPTDDAPIPSFKGDPYVVPVGDTAEETAALYWDHLDRENRVAIVAKTIDTQTGQVDYSIINELQR